MMEVNHQIEYRN